ncbi:MAG: ectoine/hydroxyectoine ABC transporter permease subunit EhuC [Gammaproteobacteria bacterium]|nr:ectoine/hydroxyectoine ABC transporter permease subunit EhuC [Gammaproteobacteria bacterium]
MASFAGFKEFIPGLLRGAVITIELTAMAYLLALVTAFLAGLGKLSKVRPIRWASITYIEIFRGTSALVQLFWIFFVLPEFGLTLTPMQAGVLALGLNVGAYGAEVVRGAIQAVPKGQYEAATALNMSRWEMMRRIILPQAIVAMIPQWGNLFIELLKTTSLVSAITLTDLTFAAYQLNQTAVRTMEIFGLAMIMYYFISQVSRIGAGSLERHLSQGLGRGRA